MVKKIKQLDHPHQSKMDAVMTITETKEVTRQISVIGLIDGAVGVVAQLKDIEYQYNAIIDDIATLAIAQEWDDKELTLIKDKVSIGGKDKEGIFTDIARVKKEKESGDDTEIVGDIDKKSILPKEEVVEKIVKK